VFVLERIMTLHTHIFSALYEVSVEVKTTSHDAQTLYLCIVRRA